MVEPVKNNKDGYLVISPKIFRPPLKPLLDHRQEEYSVEVADPEDIYIFYPGATKPQAIRHYVQERYAHTNEGIRYLLIVGDDLTPDGAHEVPVGLYPPTRKGSPGIPSDAYYGDMKGDPWPEIGVGRLPLRDPNEVAAAAGKNIYENIEDIFLETFSYSLVQKEIPKSHFIGRNRRTLNPIFNTQEKGAMAMIGSEETLSPLILQLFGHSMASYLGKNEGERLGDVFIASQRGMSDEKNLFYRIFSRLPLGLLKQFGVKTPLHEAIIREGLKINLLGDPALKWPSPATLKGKERGSNRITGSFLQTDEDFLSTKNLNADDLETLLSFFDYFFQWGPDLIGENVRYLPPPGKVRIENGMILVPFWNSFTLEAKQLPPKIQKAFFPKNMGGEVSIDRDIRFSLALDKKYLYMRDITGIALKPKKGAPHLLKEWNFDLATHYHRAKSEPLDPKKVLPTLPVENIRRSGAEICMVVDGSGSMGDPFARAWPVIQKKLEDLPFLTKQFVKIGFVETRGDVATKGVGLSKVTNEGIQKLRQGVSKIMFKGELEGLDVGTSECRKMVKPDPDGDIYRAIFVLTDSEGEKSNPTPEGRGIKTIPIDQGVSFPELGEILKPRDMEKEKREFLEELRRKGVPEKRAEEMARNLIHLRPVKHDKALSLGGDLLVIWNNLINLLPEEGNPSSQAYLEVLLSEESLYNVHEAIIQLAVAAIPLLLPSQAEIFLPKLKTIIQSRMDLPLRDEAIRVLKELTHQ